MGWEKPWVSKLAVNRNNAQIRNSHLGPAQTPAPSMFPATPGLDRWPSRPSRQRGYSNNGVSLSAINPVATLFPIYIPGTVAWRRNRNRRVGEVLSEAACLSTGRAECITADVPFFRGAHSIPFTTEPAVARLMPMNNCVTASVVDIGDLAARSI